MKKWLITFLLIPSILLSAKLTKDKRGFSVVVSASNSINKYDADYRCDGTNDEAHIDSAVTLAAGGDVILLDGTYNFGSQLIVDVDNTEIIGNGFGTVIERGWAPGEAHIIDVTATGVKIKNLVIDGNDQGALSTGHGIGFNQPSAENFYIEGVKFVGIKGRCLDLSPSSGTVSNIFILNNLQYDCDGFFVYGDGAIRGNITTNNSVSGANDGTIYLADAVSWNVLGNFIYSNGSTAEIQFVNADYCMVADNRFYEGTGSTTAISIDANSDYNVISLNTYYNIGTKVSDSGSNTYIVENEISKKVNTADSTAGSGHYASYYRSTLKVNKADSTGGVNHYSTFNALDDTAEAIRADIPDVDIIYTDPAGNVQIKLVATTTDSTFNGITTTGTAGEALSFGDICYFKSDGKYWKTDADAATTMPAVAIVAQDINQNTSGLFLKYGYLEEDNWDWTVGSLLFADITTAGGMTHVVPSANGDQVQCVGYAISANAVFFNPPYVIVEIVSP